MENCCEDTNSDTNRSELEAPPPPELTTQSVRRLLSALRTAWDTHSPETPFSIASELSPGLTIAAFCIKVASTQRCKRTPMRVQST